MLTELYPVKSHRITAFSACQVCVQCLISKLVSHLLQISFRAGQMMGDSIGGLLVHPAERSRMFDTPFWKYYPFALPCFVSGVLSVLTGILGIFTLHEVRHRVSTIIAFQTSCRPLLIGRKKERRGLPVKRLHCWHRRPLSPALKDLKFLRNMFDW